MADNVQMNSGSGGEKAVTVSLTWSGDTAQLQGVFPAIITGSEGSWSVAQVVGGAGAVSAGVQRVTLASDDPAVALLTTIDADTGNLGAILTALQGTLTVDLGANNDVTMATLPDTSAGDLAAINAALAGTIAVSASSLPLPSGASTAAKQPALGTAGTASSDVITVQGIASMTALVVDGSGVTQPISASSLPLPSGASTAANQSTIIGHVDGIETLLGTIDADTGSIATSASTIAGAVSGSEMQVDIVSSAAIPVTDNGGSLTVDGTVAATQSGTWNVTNISGTVSLPTGASTEATLSTLNGKVTACNTGAVVLSSGTLTTLTTLTGSSIAHDSADSGNPHKIGAKAISALSGATLVASADRTNVYADLDGALLIREDAALGDLVSGNASNTDGSSTSLIGAQGAGVKTYITDITLTNTSASDIYVELKDGSTAKWTFPLPAGGGVTHSFRKPLAGTANTAWNFDPSAAATTVYASASGFKSKV